MRRRGRLVSWMVVVLVGMASSLTIACNSERPSTGERLKYGQAIYGRACATCHGREGEGMPMLGNRLRDNAFMNERSDEQLVEFIKEGRPSNHELNTTGVDMPPRGGDPSLDEEDLAQLVEYLRTL